MVGWATCDRRGFSHARQGSTTGHHTDGGYARALVPQHHPIRRIKPMVDKALAQLPPTYDRMYAVNGRRKKMRDKTTYRAALTRRNRP